MCAYARIFRNELHNISLAEEIADRAEKRRSSVIASLLSSPINSQDTVTNDV